jgi:hypothetical protein
MKWWHYIPTAVGVIIASIALIVGAGTRSDVTRQGDQVTEIVRATAACKPQALHDSKRLAVCAKRIRIGLTVCRRDVKCRQAFEALAQGGGRSTDNPSSIPGPPSSGPPGSSTPPSGNGGTPEPPAPGPTPSPPSPALPPRLTQPLDPIVQPVTQTACQLTGVCVQLP